MLISIHLKKDFIYVLLFVPINFIIMIVEKYLNNNLLFKFMEYIGNICLIVFYLFEKHLENKIMIQILIPIK